MRCLVKAHLRVAFLDVGHKTFQPLYIPRGHGNGAGQGTLLVLPTRMAGEGQHGPGDSGDEDVSE